MKRVGIPRKSKDGRLSGKIYYFITGKCRNPNGVTYFIRVEEAYGKDDEFCHPIQEYKGFYNHNKDLFVLYPSKKLRSSDLDYPFMKHHVNPFWTCDMTIKQFESVGAGDLDDFLESDGSCVKSNKFKVGDIVKPIGNHYIVNLYNECVGKVIEVYSGDGIVVEVVSSKFDNLVGLSFPVLSEHFELCEVEEK